MLVVCWLFSNNSQVSAGITAIEQPICWLFRRLSASQFCNAIQAEKERDSTSARLGPIAGLPDSDAVLNQGARISERRSPGGEDRTLGYAPEPQPDWGLLPVTPPCFFCLVFTQRHQNSAMRVPWGRLCQTIHGGNNGDRKAAICQTWIAARAATARCLPSRASV